MPAQIPEFQKELRVELHAALRLGIDFHHPASNSVRIKLRVPWRIKRIREISTTPVPAQLHHLRAAIQRRRRIFGMCRAPHDATYMHGPGFFGMERIGNIVLKKFSRAPARDVKKAVVERKINVCDERRHGLEAL